MSDERQRGFGHVRILRAQLDAERLHPGLDVCCLSRRVVHVLCGSSTTRQTALTPYRVIVYRQKHLYKIISILLARDLSHC